MPLPAKLPLRLAVQFTDRVLTEVRLGLAEAGTTCEYMGQCTRIATVPYRTHWTVAYLCDEHESFLLDNTDSARLALERKLSEHRMECWLVFSYVHTNNKSGYVLEQLIEQQRGEDRKHIRAQAKAPIEARREIRGNLQRQQTRIGAPDDELLTGRQRNHLRVMTGQKPLGPTHPTGPTVVDYSEAYPSPLPFPEVELL